MSKSENHWYLLGTALGKRDGAAKRGRLWPVLGLWFLLMGLFVFFYRLFSQPGGADTGFFTGARPWVVFLCVMLLLVGGTVGVALWRMRQTRAAYWHALQAPTPAPLQEAIDHSMRSAHLHPDGAAMRAQARALGLALYGRGAEALQALGEVEWATRAPLIQATGLSGEFAVALLCERDAPRARTLAQQALALSAVNPSLPGAAQARRAYETMAAAAEAMLAAPSAEALSRLEQVALEPRFPPLQLLAAFGLACARERSGDAAGAAAVRSLLRERAPHCTPLHADLSAPGTQRLAASGPVSAGIAAGPAVVGGQGPQARATQRRLLHTLGWTVGLWLLLVLLFVAMYAFFRQPA